MLYFLFLVAALKWWVAGSCDLLTLLPCNASINSCYIHANVCANTDIIFRGFGPSWTFYFVLYTPSNTTRCYQTQNGLTEYCTLPINPTANNVTFPLSIISRQGITDDNVTFSTFPLNTDFYATLAFSACPATRLPLTAILSIYGSSFAASMFVFSIGSCITQTTPVTTPVGLLTSTATQTLLLVDVLFTGPQVGVVVLATQAQVTLINCNLNTLSTGLLPFSGSVLLALKGCTWCYVSAPPSTTVQYAIFDRLTTNLTNSSVIAYNISTIIPFAVYTPSMPPSVAPEVAQKCADNTTLQIVILSLGSVLLLIIIVAIIRRHYTKTREKSN